MKRADIKVGDHLNYIEPSDSYIRDNEVIVISDAGWTQYSYGTPPSSIEVTIDGVTRNVSLDGGFRDVGGGNGVLIVFVELGWDVANAAVVQLRCLTPWTEENAANAEIQRENRRRSRRAKAHSIGRR